MMGENKTGNLRIKGCLRLILVFVCIFYNNYQIS